TTARILTLSALSYWVKRARRTLRPQPTVGLPTSSRRSQSTCTDERECETGPPRQPTSTPGQPQAPHADAGPDAHRQRPGQALPGALLLPPHRRIAQLLLLQRLARHACSPDVPSRVPCSDRTEGCREAR